MRIWKVLFLFAAVAGIVLAMQVFAFSKADIVYPVEELGGCKDETACKAYCGDSRNMQACVSFAEKHNLMSREEIGHARKFIQVGQKGPGGCSSKESCEGYCNDITHIDECLAFGEKNGFLAGSELEEARKVQAVLKRGAKFPGGCTSKDTCESYCNDPSHMEECITFAEEAGFMPPEEREEARKALQAIKRGVKPPPCRGRNACDEYCSDPSNMEMCMNFALEAGFIPEEERENMQKMLQAVKRGVKPPPCRGEEECQEYCAEPEHFEGCMNFAVAAGFMSEEDAEMARKTGGKGPGNCRGREECEAFCEDPANQEVCFNFAKEHGMISEEDLEMMEEGKAQIQEAFEDAPPEVMDCFVSKLGSEKVEGLKSGTAMPSEQIGDVMRECFETMMQQGGMGPGGPGFGPHDGFDDEFGPQGFEGDEGGEEFYSEGFEDDGNDFGDTMGPPPGGGQFPGFQVPNQEDISQLVEAVRLIYPNAQAVECLKTTTSNPNILNDIQSGQWRGDARGMTQQIHECLGKFPSQSGNLLQTTKSFILKAWNKLRGK